MTDPFDPVAKHLMDTIVAAAEQLSDRVSPDYCSRYLNDVRDGLAVAQAEKEFQSRGGVFQDRVRDLRSDDDEENQQLKGELAFGCGVLMGGQFPGAAAAVAVAYERLFPNIDPLPYTPQD